MRVSADGADIMLRVFISRQSAKRVERRRDCERDREDGERKKSQGGAWGAVTKRDRWERMRLRGRGGRDEGVRRNMT